ncbi:MAG: hypothetical protein LBR16_04370 [Treponema sp.]|nr:hypothetical protein [Treponema sp.]
MYINAPLFWKPFRPCGFAELETLAPQSAAALDGGVFVFRDGIPFIRQELLRRAETADRPLDAAFKSLVEAVC